MKEGPHEERRVIVDVELIVVKNGRVFVGMQVLRQLASLMIVRLQSLSDRFGVLLREGFQDLRAVEKLWLTVL
jgi:hypothetical protein